MRSVLVIAAAYSCVVALSGIGAAGAAKHEQRITASGVGKVKLGARFAKLRRAGLVGRLRSGCELSGTRAARLKPPLRGFVGLPPAGEPNRVEQITIAGGAKARGVGVGATRGEVRDAFPHASFDSSSEPIFGITTVRIPKRDGGNYQMALSTVTGRVTGIYVPRILFCD